jgi:hypothetical protein
MLFLSQYPVGLYTMPSYRHTPPRMHDITAVHQYAGIQHPGLIALARPAKQYNHYAVLGGGSGPTIQSQSSSW